MSLFLNLDPATGTYKVVFANESALLLECESLDQASRTCSLLNGGDGLSHLHRFTMAAMQGVAANPEYSRSSCNDIAVVALDIAKETIELLKEEESA